MQNKSVKSCKRGKTSLNQLFSENERFMESGVTGTPANNWSRKSQPGWSWVCGII